MTALHIACKKGYNDMADVFIKFQSDLDAKDS